MGEVGKPKEATKGEPISVHFRDTPLGEAIDLLAQPLGLNLVIPSGLDQSVTVNFPSIAPRDALDAILAQHGFRLETIGAVTLIHLRDSAPGLVSETFRISSGNAVPEEQLKSLLSSRGSLQVDGTGTALVVTDEPVALDRLRAFLAVADQRRPQVLIEALIMEVQHDSGFGLGMIASTQNNQIGDFESNAVSDLALETATNGTQPFLFNLFSDEWDSLIEITANENTSLVNVLSNPLLTTISGKEAKLEVIEKIPYVDATQQITVDGGGSQSSAQQITFADVGIRMKVTPIVGGDKIIEMTVEPEVLELVDFVQGIPVIDERKVSTTVYVRNNETIVLAGLLRDDKRTRQDKVPFLGDIPLVGSLFRRDIETQEKRELLIFLTPHLMGAGAERVDGFQAQEFLLDQQRRFPVINDGLTRQSLGPRVEAGSEAGR